MRAPLPPLATLALAAALLAGCGDFMATRDPGTPGWAGVAFTVVAMGGALGKVACGNDTLVDLRTLHLQFTASGMPTQYRAVSLAGNIHAGNLIPAIQLVPLWGPRNWKLKAWTTDAVDSVLHLDSTTLYVEPGDTTALSFALNPRYTVLVGRFISQSSSITSIEKLELRVNNVVVDDTVFSPKKKIFNVVLSSKYLKAGVSSSIKLNALDRASPARITYTKTVSVNPALGGESVIAVELK